MDEQKKTKLALGAFSISLTVKNLDASKAFYEKLGFESSCYFPDQGWTMMKNGDTVIGLFQGMFDKNMLTFNPGWHQDASEQDTFTDVRELQKQLKQQGVEFQTEADEASSGPASFIIEDPDGNPILVDQHR